jgi:chemotaxis response regulator CheB
MCLALAASGPWRAVELGLVDLHMHRGHHRKANVTGPPTRNRSCGVNGGPRVVDFGASAACLYGRRVVGVVLSGKGRDGAAGVRLIHNLGGLALAQDPTEATASQMPAAAIATSRVGYHSIPVDAAVWIAHDAIKVGFPVG